MLFVIKKCFWFDFFLIIQKKKKKILKLNTNRLVKKFFQYGQNFYMFLKKKRVIHINTLYAFHVCFILTYIAYI
jgi:hypothetical protein